MKRKITTILMMIMLVFGVTACKDDDSIFDDSKLPAPISGSGDTVGNMPITNNKNEIEEAIEDVFGIDIDLPQGNYSTQTYGVNGGDSYVVTVSGSNMTVNQYYNSIRSEMLENGYTEIEGEYSYFKVVGTIVYSVGIEEDEGNIFVYMGTTNPSSDVPGITDDSGNQGQSDDGGTTIQPTNPYTGELSAFPIAKIRNMFGFLGVTIPDFTYGTTYTIEAERDDAEKKRIKIICYGVTSEEVSMYAQELKDAGFVMAMAYSHNNSYWSNIVVERSSHSERQTHTITFWADCYGQPAYTLPENLKVVYSDGIYQNTAIKIGNDYYLNQFVSFGGYGSTSEEIYYKYDETIREWHVYERYNGGEWEDLEYTEAYVEYVEEDIFGFMVEYSEIDEEAIKDELQETICDMTVDVYTLDDSYYGYVAYKEVDTGLLLKYISKFSTQTYTYIVESYDDTITSFDVDLPTV